MDEHSNSNQPTTPLATPQPVANDPMLSPKPAPRVEDSKSEYQAKDEVKAKTNPKKTNQNYTAAIMATIVIIIVLSALAVYAYLKRQ